MIDKRKSYFLTLDTETCNGYLNNEGKLELQDSMVYDIGGIIHDKQGNIYETINLVIPEVFYKMDDLMISCYYSKKLPQYHEEIEKGIRKVVKLERAKEIVKDLCDKYQVKAIIAHNAFFDYRALNNTQRYITKSSSRYFLPYGVEIWDSQKMAHDTICKQKLYIKWCQENGYMTHHKTPRPRESAEVLYRYISGDENFVESHTGLKDCEIEMVISCKCMAQHKPMKKLLFEE
ncbi:MAG: hypothetical protein KBT30_00630 [Clostridiales bacterium]|nr:hypothetical protein [Candidatus Apopatousia equi]